MSVKRTTHCKYMHPLSGDNLYVSPRGTRSCKACRKASKAAYRLKRGHVPVDTTRCRKGHPFDEENTVIKKSGQRACRICMTATAKAYRAARDHEKDNDKRRKPGGLADRHRAAGVAAERAAIVAWLRDQVTCGCGRDDCIADNYPLGYAADIENGAHTQQQGEYQ